MEGIFPYRCRFTSFPKSIFLFLGIILLGSQFFVFWHLVMQLLYKVCYIKHQVSLYLWRNNLYLSAVKFQNIRSLVAVNKFKCRKFHQSLVESRMLNKPWMITSWQYSNIQILNREERGKETTQSLILNSSLIPSWQNKVKSLRTKC